jgi:hypothetical protein
MTIKSGRAKKMALAHIMVGGVSAFLGIMGTLFAAMGVCVFCLAPVVGLLGVFGLSVGVLADYSLYFMTPGIVLITLGILLYWKKVRCKKCKAG